MLTGRDAAHKRIADMLAPGEELPVSFKGRMIYYVGPVDPVGEEIVGPAGPTTATRMDKFMDMMLEQGLLGCVGKAERGPSATQAIQAQVGLSDGRRRRRLSRRPRDQGQQGSSASKIWAWKRFTNSR
jgi:tartrate dehydratase beta subunit/fumarate hydratase class I family protein